MDLTNSMSAISDIFSEFNPLLSEGRVMAPYFDDHPLLAPRRIRRGMGGQRYNKK